MKRGGNKLRQRQSETREEIRHIDFISGYQRIQKGESSIKVVAPISPSLGIEALKTYLKNASARRWDPAVNVEEIKTHVRRKMLELQAKIEASES